VIEVDSPRFGKYLRHRAIAVSRTRWVALFMAPFKESTTERLMRELAYTDEQIADLYARRLIHWEEVRRLALAR
jgi:hypothetical protein